MWTLRLWSLLMVSLDGWLQKKTMEDIQDVEFIHPTALHGILSEDAQYMNQEGISSYVLKKMKGKAQQGCIC